jgi:serine/threonine-protein kinase
VPTTLRSPEPQSATALRAELGQEQPGRYHLRRELARGGQGVVSVAWDAHLGREVAFKQLLGPARASEDGTLSAAEARFVREARITAQLDHPGIAPLYEVGLRADGSLYATQRLVKGRTLRAALAGCATLEDRLRLLPALRSVCQTVAFAHRRGVIHRDLKPDNVMVLESGEAVVLDWGLGRTGEEALTLAGPGAAVDSLMEGAAERTLAGTLLGTPAYMSPEQASGDGVAVDARTDVWSLGVMLFEVLAGRRPFEGTSSAELLRSVQVSRPPPVRALCPGAPEALASLAERALRRRPEERPRDAAAFSAELEAAAAGLARRGLPPWGWVAAALVVVGLGAAAALLASRQPGPAPAEPAAEASIAVLPFEDLSPEHDQGAFSDGVAEEILGALSRVDGLKVAGRASSFYLRGKGVEPRELAARLGVQHLLEGTVRRAGSRLRLSAELLRAADGARVWSQTFDREVSEVFAVQEEIARAVAGALELKLAPGKPLQSPGRRTTNPGVYTEYQLGRQLYGQFSEDSIRRSAEAFRRALALDPDYAPALAGLSMALDALQNQLTPRDERGRLRRDALEAANRAVAVAPELADGYLARALLPDVNGWDWTQALADARRAVALGPRSAEAHRALGAVLSEVGRASDGIPEAQLATELDPLSSRMWNMLGWLAVEAGQSELGHRALGRALEISPENIYAGGNLARLLVLEGKPEEALASIERSRGKEVFRLMYPAMALHALGHRRESEAALRALVERHGAEWPLRVAEVHAFRGERDRAFEWLDRALRQGDSMLRYFGYDPFFQGLRADPRHAALLHALRLDALEGAGAAAAPVTPSIAVLPFVDLSPGHDQGYFSEGVAEEILTALVRVEGLRVPGRASSFRFKGTALAPGEVARQLGVGHLLEGSVRRAGGQLRVSAEVVRAEDGALVWRQTFDRSASDVFKVQDEIAAAVVSALRVRLLAPADASASGEGATSSVEAYSQYLLGRQLFHLGSPESYRGAVAAYRKALERDDRFAPAWAGLAIAANYASNFAEGGAEFSDRQRLSREAGERAVALAPELPEALAARGYVRAMVEYDWSGAEADLRRAIELRPRDAELHRLITFVYFPRARVAEALEEAREATLLDPGSPLAWNSLGLVRIDAGQYAEARSALEEALRLSPDQSFAALNLVKALILEGRSEQALNAARRALAPRRRLSGSALALHALGRDAEARQALAELEQGFGATSPYQIALVHISLGDLAQGLDWLERALATHDRELAIQVSVDPFLRPIRGEARYRALLQGMHLGDLVLPR